MAESETTDDQREANRQLAGHMVNRTEWATGLAAEQLIKTSGWLSASLLAINGGGALASINLVDKSPNALWSAATFGGGALFAILSAYAIQAVATRSFAPSEKILLFWRRAQLSGEWDGKEYSELEKPLANIYRYKAVAPGLGWVSGMCFLAAALMLGASARYSDPDSAGRCRALQADMLSTRPKRSDSRELFVALRCEASGSGKVSALPDVR